ncbi:hypothetical protein HK102_010964 [Quaeritorhiza haematococci]|nr:hypothetical protein HK102_010964 [Quaeritorhiza haematococci]
MSTEDDLLEMEAKLLPILEGPLCLDSNPAVGKMANLAAYNENKYRVKRKRRRDWAEREEEEAKKKESNKLMMIMEQERDFHPRFNQLAFIEEWRKKKSMADAEPMIGLDNKKVRGKMHTILNVYETEPDEFEAVLRWGNVEGTSTGNGNTLRYPLGNAVAAEHYIAHFRNFYGLTNNLLADTATQKTLGSSSSPATTAATLPGTAPPAAAQVSQDCVRRTFETQVILTRAMLEKVNANAVQNPAAFQQPTTSNPASSPQLLAQSLRQQSPQQFAGSVRPATSPSTPAALQAQQSMQQQILNSLQQQAVSNPGIPQPNPINPNVGPRTMVFPPGQQGQVASQLGVGRGQNGRGTTGKGSRGRGKGRGSS